MKHLSTFTLIGLSLSTSLAADFYGNGISARTRALGGAYAPSANNALDAMAINPAALSLLAGSVLNLSATAIAAQGSFSNAANKGAGMDRTAGIMPFGAFGTALGKSRFSIGASVTPDMISESNWHYQDAPGAAGTASYGFVSHHSAIRAIRTAGGVSIRLRPSLAIGATVGAVYNSNELASPYIFQSHPALRGLKTQLDLRTKGTGWNYTAGLLYRPANRVLLGVAYKSRTVINSTGTASGNLGAQFAAVGLAAQPDFRYQAGVRNVLPETLTANFHVRLNSRWNVAAQAEAVMWANAFSTLPVRLTEGTNRDINGLLGTSSLADDVPVQWKNQVIWRGGAERVLTEMTVLRFGYSYRNNPVPSSTLTPLTAAILRQSVSAGWGLQTRRFGFDVAYSLSPWTRQSVGRSGLAGGEYSNSSVRLLTHTISLTLTTALN